MSYVATGKAGKWGKLGKLGKWGKLGEGESGGMEKVCISNRTAFDDDIYHFKLAVHIIDNGIITAGLPNVFLKRNTAVLS